MRNAVKVTDTDPDDLRTLSKFQFLMQQKRWKYPDPQKRTPSSPPSYLFLVQWPLMATSLVASLSHVPVRPTVGPKKPFTVCSQVLFIWQTAPRMRQEAPTFVSWGGSGRQFADVCKIFRVKVALVILALRCLPSRANTESSWGGSACRTMSACLQVFTYPSRRPSPLHLHTEAVQTCHTCSYQTRHLYLLSVSGSMFTCAIMFFRFYFNNLITCLAAIIRNKRLFFLKKALWKKKGEREMKWGNTVNSQWCLLLFLMFSSLR